jgi:CheY-like chemotaxis protein
MTNARILVAEDDPAFRRVIRYTLEREGFTVVAVSDGDAALAELNRSKFDWLVTDHEMPGLSGSELIEKVRSVPDQFPQLRILLCTARGLELDAARIGEQYQVAVMHKPFSPRGLVGVLTEIESREPVA